MEKCLFCKIVNGLIPSTKVYEDADVVAFLDIHPVNIGHTLVVPKMHTENFLTVELGVLQKTMAAAQKLAQSVMQATKAQGFNIHINNGRASGQEIDHLHVHIIPRFAADGLKHWPKVEYQEGEMEKVAKAIKALV